MKTVNIIKAIPIALFVLCAPGCNSSMLDLTPPLGETTDNFYQTEDQAFQSLVSAYGVLCMSAPPTHINGNYVNCAYEVTSEILGDCCFAGGEGGAGFDQPTFRRSTFTALSDDNAAEALWRKYYMGIARCNTFFAHIDTPPFQDENLRERYKAEAHFLRAYYYFDLVRLFGNVPMPLRELAPSDYAFPQSTPEETYKQIGIDLLAAINTVGSDGLPVMYSDAIAVPSGEKGRATIAAAKSLLARVWLYYTGYYGKTEMPGPITAEQIRGYLDDVINHSSHTLMPNAYDLTNVATVGVTPMFQISNNNNVESVFEIQFSGLGKAGYGNRIDSRGNQGVLLWGMRINTAPYTRGWSYATVDKNLWDKFDPADPRRRASIISVAAEGIAVPNPGETYQYTGYFGRKYTTLAANSSTIGGDPVLNWPNNFYVIRFADVLLMASEMELLHGGDPAKAFDYYKRVRERAMGAGNVGITQAQLTLDRIYDERLFELALEGVRYWDILRRGQDYAAATLTRQSDDPLFRVTYDRTRAGLFPIPLYDILQSKNTLKQNPGYTN